jgi:PAS domain S-box-containing protein
MSTDNSVECRKIEAALKESNERFSKAFHNSPNPMIISRLSDGVAIDVNDRFLQLFEFSREQVIGHKSADYDIILPQPERQVFLQDLIEKEATSNFELQGQIHNGQSLFLIISAVKVNFSGEPHAIVVFTDITERKKVEDQLRKSEERFRSVLEGTLDVIYRFNLQTQRYEYMSPSIRRLGFEPQEMTAMTNSEVFSRIHPDDLSAVKAELTSLMFVGRGYSEYRFKGKDGVYRWWSNQMILINDENGKPLYRDGDVRDISVSKAVEAALKERTEQLEQTQKKLEDYSEQMENLALQRAQRLQETERLAAIGQTAGMVGHDIRNPLQAMMSDVWLLKELLFAMPQSETRGEVAESLDGLEKNIGYVNKIVADLQDYARPLKPEYTTFDVSEIVTSVFKTIILPENIKLIVDVKAPNKVRSEATFIQRALTNLVNNAIQAMPNGGNLTINVKEFNEGITFSIKDTGAGIPEEIKTKIFSPMTTTKSKGQGLGLAVVKRLVEALNGTVTFDSTVGVGSTFFIELPMSPLKS